MMDRMVKKNTFHLKKRRKKVSLVVSILEEAFVVVVHPPDVASDVGMIMMIRVTMVPPVSTIEGAVMSWAVVI